MYKEFLIGPYSIYEFDSNVELTDQVLNEVKKLNYNKPRSGIRADLNLSHTGYISDQDVDTLYPGNGEVFYHQELYDWLYDCLNIVETKHLKNSKLKIVDLWGFKTSFGCHQDPHIHVNSMFSGTFHLVDCKRGELVFSIPDYFFDKWRFLFSEHIQNNPISVTIPCKKGKLYIWPSFITHSVNTHIDRFDRYSLAFNTFCEIKDNWDSRRLSLAPSTYKNDPK